MLPRPSNRLTPYKLVHVKTVPLRKSVTMSYTASNARSQAAMRRTSVKPSKPLANGSRARNTPNLRNTRPRTPQSTPYTHAKTTEHQISPEVAILDKEEQWFERGVKEAIWKRVEAPSLDKKGSLLLKLSHAWDQLLRNIPHRLLCN